MWHHHLRRSKGEPEQLIDLVETSRDALKQVLAEKGAGWQQGDEFIDKVPPIIHNFFAHNSTVSTEELPELNVARPPHGDSRRLILWSRCVGKRATRNVT